MSERILVRDLQQGDLVVVDIIFEGRVLVKAGTVLSEVQAAHLHRRYRNLEVSVNAITEESRTNDTEEQRENEQQDNCISSISSLSGEHKQRTVNAIHAVYGRFPEEWDNELREIKHCTSQIVTTVKTSDNLCYDFQDFVTKGMMDGKFSENLLYDFQSFVTEDMTGDKTKGNLYRVAKIAIAIANVYNNTAAKSEQISLEDIGMAALLHDYGKSFKNKKDGISKLRADSELFRKLNLHSQFFKMPYKPQLHSVYAYAALKSTIPEKASKILLLSGLHNSIVNKFDPKNPEVRAAKAITLCYAYDSLLEIVIRGNYSNPLENALSFIDQGVMNGDYSKLAYKLFMDNILIYAPGTKVILSNGESATVLGNNRSFPSRPLVLTDGKQGEPKTIDLSETINITIQQILLKEDEVNSKVNDFESLQMGKIVVKDN